MGAGAGAGNAAGNGAALLEPGAAEGLQLERLHTTFSTHTLFLPHTFTQHVRAGHVRLRRGWVMRISFIIMGRGRRIRESITFNLKKLLTDLF